MCSKDFFHSIKSKIKEGVGEEGEEEGSCHAMLPKTTF
jgi:hypothetical protein